MIIFNIPSSLQEELKKDKFPIIRKVPLEFVLEEQIINIYIDSGEVAKNCTWSKQVMEFELSCYIVASSKL